MAARAVFTVRSAAWYCLRARCAGGTGGNCLIFTVLAAAVPGLGITCHTRALVVRMVANQIGLHGRTKPNETERPVFKKRQRNSQKEARARAETSRRNGQKRASARAETSRRNGQHQAGEKRVYNSLDGTRRSPWFVVVLLPAGRGGMWLMRSGSPRGGVQEGPGLPGLLRGTNRATCEPPRRPDQGRGHTHTHTHTHTHRHPRHSRAT